MKKPTKLNLLFLLAMVALMYACQKSGVTNNSDKLNTSPQAIINAQAILVSEAFTTSTTGSDAVYVIHAYTAGFAVDSITFASLPTNIAPYLTANYFGYVFKKAYQVLNTDKITDNYVVVIQFNGKPVGLKFDANGTFVKVLEQCEGHDLGGSQPWHEGGRFDFRDGLQHDTVAISALSTAIQLYFTAHYPTDTLLHAILNVDGTYTVISTNKGLFATTITSLGSYIGRVQIYLHANKCVPINSTGLPAPAVSYLNSIYPGYVIDQVIAAQIGMVTAAYNVVINVNGTRMAIEFDASGKFVRSIVIR